MLHYLYRLHYDQYINFEYYDRFSIQLFPEHCDQQKVRLLDAREACREGRPTGWVMHRRNGDSMIFVLINATLL